MICSSVEAQKERCEVRTFGIKKRFLICTTAEGQSETPSSEIVFGMFFSVEVTSATHQLHAGLKRKQKVFKMHSKPEQDGRNGTNGSSSEARRGPSPATYGNTQTAETR